MLLCYSGKSAPSAQAIADCDDDIFTTRSSNGDVNWGRSRANTRLNPDITNATNKRVMRQLFAEHDVPTPALWRPEEAKALYLWETPLVGRPDTHTKGRGFWKCETLSDIQRALKGTRKKKAATHFMEFVESDREYRVHIFRGKSIRISEKRFEDETKKEYTTVKPGNISLRRVRRAAKDAVQALGLDFGAVDVLATGDDNERVYVLEVNAAPGLGGTMPELYAKIFKEWYDEEN